jgi:hypothetical protein
VHQLSTKNIIKKKKEKEMGDVERDACGEGEGGWF